MINRGVGESLRQSLHDSLLEGIILCEMLSETHTQVVVFTLETREETEVCDGQAKVLRGIKLKCVMNVEKLQVLFILDIIIESLKVEGVQEIESRSECTCII